MTERDHWAVELLVSTAGAVPAWLAPFISNEVTGRVKEKGKRWQQRIRDEARTLIQRIRAGEDGPELV